MKRVVARGLLIVSVLSAFAALGPAATAHHGHTASGKLHHCRWQPHEHPDSFYEGKSASFVRRHTHHGHLCDPDRYPPD